MAHEQLGGGAHRWVRVALDGGSHRLHRAAELLLQLDSAAWTLAQSAAAQNHRRPDTLTGAEWERYYAAAVQVLLDDEPHFSSLTQESYND